MLGLYCLASSAVTIRGLWDGLSSFDNSLYYPLVCARVLGYVTYLFADWSSLDLGAFCATMYGLDQMALRTCAPMSPSLSI